MRELVVGVGLRPGTDPAAVCDAVAAVLRELDPAPVRVVATLSARAQEPGVRQVAGRLGATVLGYAADELAAAAGPVSSAVVARAVGTPAVAEPAARLAAGAAGTATVSLLVGRTVVGGVVVAVAERDAPCGAVDPAADPPQWPWSPRAHTGGSTVPGATAGRGDHPGGRVNTT